MLWHGINYESIYSIKYTEAVDKLKKNFKLEVDVPPFDKMKTEFSNNPNSGG